MEDEKKTVDIDGIRFTVDLPVDVHRKTKILSAMIQKSMRSIVIEALNDYTHVAFRTIRDTGKDVDCR